jgi:photosystem II stability/assembly factor-like uncharacterized protein
MAVTAPPRPPDSSDPVQRDELEALVEALIEEARRRARRRRRRYGACILLAALAAGGVYFGFHEGGGAVGQESARADSSGGAAPGTALAGGRWSPSHGPYGGPAYVVAVAPSRPDIVYAGTVSGVFKSRDGGRSWRSAGLAVRNTRLEALTLRITSLAVDPHRPGTVYAARSGWFEVGKTLRQQLFRSTDGGRTWRTLGLPARIVAISPTGTVFAIVEGRSLKHHLFRSTNGGRSWQVADRDVAGTRFSGLAFDPRTPATVYAATEHGVLASTDSGRSWRSSGGPARQGASAVAVDPSTPQIVYAGTKDGVIKSVDGGQSWRMVNSVLADHGRDRGYGGVSSLAVDPRDSQKVYATVGCTGIFKSSDGGRRWRSANALHDFDCLDSSLALDPDAPETMYAAYPSRDGVFKSTDGGARWQPANVGLALTTISSIAVDPQHPQILYASAGSEGLFRSGDGGAHWLSVGRRLRSVDAVAIDRHDPRIVLAAGAVHRVIRSIDAGHTWQTAGAGMTGRVAALAISGRNAYAGTWARGVFSSVDGGQSWEGFPGPGNNYVRALALDPNDPTVVYAGSWGSEARGLSKSTDGGRTWQRLADGLEDSDVYAVALDPRDPATIYIGTGGGGVFKSTDGGASWQHASSGLTRIRVKGTTPSGNIETFTVTVGVTALAIDPARPTTIYAATDERGVFRSPDAGVSWHPFNAGLAASDIASLTVDATGRTLYAGTVAGGVVALHVRAD